MNLNRVTYTFFAACLLCSSMSWGQRNLNGLIGLACNIDLTAKSCVLLTTTDTNAETGERTWQYQVLWNDNTNFTKVTTLASLAAFQPEDVVQIDMTEQQAELARQGKNFQPLRLTALPAGSKASGWANNSKTRLFANLTAISAQSAEVKVDDSVISMRTPNRNMQRLERCAATDLVDSISRIRVTGAPDDAGRFVCSKIDLYPQADPRLTDNPSLPRVLVIGDSISMNYHEAAKEALAGKANYYRIPGNSAHTRNGLLNFELWLGNTAVKGLHWDLVVINHGLHDLRVMDNDQHQISLDQYQKNLRAIFQLATSKSFKVVWCTTTPVPNTRTTGAIRRKDDDLIYNQAAAEVLKEFPTIAVCDLNALVRGSEIFDQWREGVDVHYRDAERVALGNKVAETIMATLAK